MAEEGKLGSLEKFMVQIDALNKIEFTDRYYLEFAKQAVLELLNSSVVDIMC